MSLCTSARVTCINHSPWIPVTGIALWTSDILSAWPDICGTSMEEPVFHVYSQTPSTASGASARYAEEIHAQFGTTDVHVHLDSLTIPTFHAFVHADALVLSVSDFSYTAAILRTAGPVIYFPFWFLPLKSWCVALKSESDVIPTGGLTKKALSVPSNSSAFKSASRCWMVVDRHGRLLEPPHGGELHSHKLEEKQWGVPPPHLNRPELLLQWKNRHGDLSPMASSIHRAMTDCSRPRALYSLNNYGMGASLHYWSQEICSALGIGARLVAKQGIGTHSGFWVWEDQNRCGTSKLQQPLSCYFGPLAPHCSTQLADISFAYGRKPNLYASAFSPNCTELIKRPVVMGLAAANPSDRSYPWRIATMEYLFANVSQMVIDAAEKALIDIFPSEALRARQRSLITMHIRWGDKGREMTLMPVTEYFRAVRALVVQHRIRNPQVFVTTEDTRALVAFKEAAANEGWSAFSYTPALLADPSVTPGLQAKSTRGSAGFYSMVALLLALEARHYVLTTKSNWSRLIDELRRGVLDRFCGGCSTMNDLMPGSYGLQDYDLISF